MNKTELVATVATSCGLTKTDADRAVDGLIDAITTALKDGDEVRLAGFGTFFISHRAAGEGRNPRTGERIAIAASRLPKFSAGKRLKETVNA